MIAWEASMSNVEVIGIDVAARTLAVCAETLELEREWENTPAAHAALAKRLARSTRPVRVVVEATGIYFLDLARTLAAAGNAVMVVNPKASHHFAEALLERRKDDPVDAAVLRDYGRRMPWTEWRPPDATIFRLREIGRQVLAFRKDIVAAKNRRHALAATALGSAAVRRAVTRQIAATEALIATLAKAAERLLAKAPELRRRVELIDGIPGFARQTAIVVAGELAPLPPGMSARQWVAQAGLDVREVRSGSSVIRRARISKRGNRRLREALYWPAMTMVRCCPEAAAFARRLVGAGKTPLQAIGAVMRKLLHGIHAMWRHDAPFAPAKLFGAAPRPGTVPLFDQDATVPSSRPRIPAASRTAALKARRRRPPKAARSGLDRREHDAELVPLGSDSA
jgi:transposase